MRYKSLVKIVLLMSLFLLTGCEKNHEEKNSPSSIEIQEDCESYEVSLEEEKRTDMPTSESLQEDLAEEDGVVEIYAGGDVINISEDRMTAQISPQDILTGNPILYNRFQADGWIFEWLISDYDDDNWFLEEGVLVISREGNTEEIQIVPVKAEGGYATWVSANNKFEYVDVNFDTVPDLLICTGHHGNQGALTYYCFLQTDTGFVEAPTFSDIPNPSIDAENQLILSQWRNSAASHSWAEYKYEDNIFVLSRELREELLVVSDEEIWIWTVNGEEVGRSNELSKAEIENLLYNDNSEWNLSHNRWQILYNNGMMSDYSIYAEPIE
ncbi:hypothetical protein C804_06437 [Lachnospiraceae bacterium A4]|nr:hypothetical protein C804_06437 [Lachnospiraceae bacterium A4]